jgi:hypothetical protein
MNKRTIYYLPGAGGQIQTGIGQGLLDRGFDITGRETRGEFKNLEFRQQIDLVANDLQSGFWTDDAKVICNSFGAYLFLHAQAGLDPFPGHLLLLSPIVGHFVNEDRMMGFVPPRSRRLMELAASGDFPMPKKAEIHVGEQDWQSHPDAVRRFGEATGIPVTFVPNRGHALGKDYVGKLLDQWLWFSDHHETAD